MSFRAHLNVAIALWERDSELPLGMRVDKAKDFLIGKAMAPWHLRKVNKIGRNVRVLNKPRIKNHGHIEISDDTVLRSVVLPLELTTSSGGKIIIGKQCSINYGVSISASRLIKIGNRVLIGPYVMILDCQYHEIYNRKKSPKPEPVRIEDDVWIGAKSSILPGVTIGRGSIVGAHSLVNHDVPPFSIFGGVPAKLIGKIDEKKYMEINRRETEKQF